jgi:hypothetical protein
MSYDTEGIKEPVFNVLLHAGLSRCTARKAPAMKINEKNLAAFASSATPVDREGWLVKRGEVNRGYQRRWFVLKGNLLFYFEKRGDKEPVGVIVLEGCTIGMYSNSTFIILSPSLFIVCLATR